MRLDNQDQTEAIGAGPRRVGILGGAFDPWHLGHLAVARAARERAALDAIVLMPTGQPAHFYGKTTRASALDRLAMARLAALDEPWLEASDLEVNRPGPSYAIDTVSRLAASQSAGGALFWIAGGDAIAEVPTWHRAAELVALCGFVALARPGFDGTQAAAAWRERGLEAAFARVLWCRASGPPISSTGVRAAVAAGHGVEEMVPPAVARFIAQRGLYRSG